MSVSSYVGILRASPHPTSMKSMQIRSKNQSRISRLCIQPTILLSPSCRFITLRRGNQIPSREIADANTWNRENLSKNTCSQGEEGQETRLMSIN